MTAVKPARPTMRQLWDRAGAGTPGYDRDQYLMLLRLHGYEPAADLEPVEGASHDGHPRPYLVPRDAGT